MIWHFPLAFFLLIPLGLALAYYFFWRKKNTTPLTVLSPTPLQKILGLCAEIPILIFSAGLVCVILALARPQKILSPIKKTELGVDIFITLDISGSMLIEDMSPGNRINASKSVIRDFIMGSHSDRLGLILFSGESYTRVPLTLDYPIVLQHLEETKTSFEDPFIKQGTAIGLALTNVALRFKDSKAKSKVAILLTDGEDNIGGISPETAIEIVKQSNIRVHTIAIGSRSGRVPIPKSGTDLFGRETVTYQYIENTINFDLLKTNCQRNKWKVFYG